MSTQKLSVSVENLAPENGTSLTPTWIGFHNGGFDTFSPGEEASPGLESIAEDGDAATLSREFFNSGAGNVDTVVGAGSPIAPGETAQDTVEVDAREGRYLNYAAMVLPSNDTFIANGNPLAFEIFDENGNFIGTEFIVPGSLAWDAGTEVNDELPANTAFFGQTAPDTGVNEGGVVALAQGFNPVGSGGILDDPRFASGDYTVPGYQFARIRVALQIDGTDGRDSLFGTSAQEDFFAGEGDNFLSGNGGNDRFYAGSGNDQIFGGSGDNVIEAGDGNNQIFGNAGDDRITTGVGDDRIFAGPGNDIIQTGAGDDEVFAQIGDHFIDVGVGRDRILAGRGDDTFVLNAGEGEVLIVNYGSNDVFSLGAGLSEASIELFTRGNDTVIRSGDDVLATLQGVQTSRIEIV